MKLLSAVPALCLAFFVGSSPHVEATVTLQFGSTSIFASNWANGAGVGGTSLYWGIVVDRNGDGLAPSYQPTGINYGAGTAGPGIVGQSLINGGGGLTDDVLFMSQLVMHLAGSNHVGRDGVELGDNMFAVIPSIPFLPGTNAGDPFYLVWFDRSGPAGSAPAGVPVEGEKFGIFGNSLFTLPSEGSTIPYTSVFAGTDPLKPMNHAFVPEPGVTALGLFGLAGLLRRRRPDSLK